MKRDRTCIILALLLITMFLIGCGGQEEEPASTLNKAEHDSVLSESPLPGASGVKGALAAADSAKARAARANAVAQ